MNIFKEFIIQELFDFISINNLLNTCNDFKQYKKQFMYWRFNELNSKRYFNGFISKKYESIDFYTNIKSMCFEEKKQLSLIWNYNDINEEYIKFLGNVHSLKIKLAISIIDNGITFLGNIHILDLSGNGNLMDTHLIHLVNIHSLNLSYCNSITDKGVKLLGRVHILNLGKCNKITDESIQFLGRVHTLNLRETKITDYGLKFLDNCHTLDLSFCSKITDEGVSLLGKLYNLTLCGCYNITNNGIIYLGGIHTLNLMNCYRILEDVFKYFWNVHILNITCCGHGYNITDEGMKYLTHHRKLRTIRLGSCDKITEYGLCCLENSNVKILDLNKSYERNMTIQKTIY